MYFNNLVEESCPVKTAYIFNIPITILHYILVSPSLNLRSILGDPNISWPLVENTKVKWKNVDNNFLSARPSLF